MAAQYAQAEELIQAVEAAQRKDRFQPGERLIISASDFYGSSWTRIDGVLDEDSFRQCNWREDEDVLRAVLTEVRGRLPGSS